MVTEAGSMIAMSGNIELETSTHQKGKGGILSGIKRMFAGESFFLNHYKTKSEPGEVWLAPTLPGDMKYIKLMGKRLWSSPEVLFFVMKIFL